MNNSLYDIECYDEEVFKSVYTIIYNRILKVADRHGVDLSKFYFSQYLKSNKIEDICYVLIEDEDVSLNIEYHNGQFERCELTRD